SGKRVPGALNTRIPAVAWMVDCWARNQSRKDLRDQIGTADLRGALERCVASAAEKARPAVSMILTARRTTYRDFEGKVGPAIASVLPELGALADAVCAAEL